MAETSRNGDPPPLDPAPRSADLDPAVLLHQVLDTVPAGLFTIDPVGTITSWNRGMETLTGLSALEMLGQPCTSLGGDGCFGGAHGGGNARCPLFREGEIRDRRCTVRRRDGGRVPVLINARLFRDDGGRIVGALEAVADLGPTLKLEQQVSTLRDEAAARLRFGGLVGRHPAMLRLQDVIELAARSHLPVLIRGETGAGKELVARAIHEGGDRKDRPFVRVSCAALSERLLESELFGHVRGAFPGATAARQGRLEAADGGTLFLDEVADISPALQAKLLRVLESSEFERQGDPRPVRVNLRIVAATHEDLAALADRGLFRRDLYFRLAVLPVNVPPLRDRASDVPLLVEHFLARLNRALGRAIAGVTPDAMRRLCEYGWPGNVRELEHAIEYAVVLTRGDRIEEGALPPALHGAPEEGAAQALPHRPRSSTDRDRILQALQRTGGNRTEEARLLGVSRVTLWKWMKAMSALPEEDGQP
jgi:PAS domain S-box-containing protein